MNVIAATETRRKNGRRTVSLAPCKSPQAPPRFRASVNVRWVCQSGTTGGYVSSRCSAQNLLPISEARVTIETTARKTNEGCRLLGSRALLAAPRGGGRRGTPGAGTSGGGASPPGGLPAGPGADVASGAWLDGAAGGGWFGSSIRGARRSTR